MRPKSAPFPFILFHTATSGTTRTKTWRDTSKDRSATSDESMQTSASSIDQSKSEHQQHKKKTKPKGKIGGYITAKTGMFPNININV